jgi:hypothetical protein
MELKPTLISIGIMIGLVGSAFINIAGRSLLEWGIFSTIGGVIIIFIFMELYTVVSGRDVDMDPWDNT